MKIWALMTTMALLCLSSCGLFRKTTHKANLESEVTLNSTQSVKGKRVKTSHDLTIDRSQITSKFRGNLRIYPKPGTKTTIDKDGNIVGDVDSIVSDLNSSTEKLNNIANNIGSKDSSETDSLGQQNLKAKSDEETKTVIKEPDKTSLAIVYSIIAAAVVIIILIVLRLRH